MDSSNGPELKLQSFGKVKEEFSGEINIRDEIWYLTLMAYQETAKNLLSANVPSIPIFGIECDFTPVSIFVLFDPN